MTTSCAPEWPQMFISRTSHDYDQGDDVRDGATMNPICIYFVRLVLFMVD